MARRRFPRIYDEERYHGFGEQPPMLEIQLGYCLIPLVNEKDKKLLREISYLRNQMDAEYGIILPLVSIMDNMTLDPTEYALLINGVEMGRFNFQYSNGLLCIKTDFVTQEIKGPQTKEPAFGRDAIIVSEEKRRDLEDAGYIVLDYHLVIRTHFTEIIKKNFSKLITRSMVNELINKVRPMNPDVVDDLILENKFPISNLKKILIILLEEGISVRDMNTIMEAIADYITLSMNPYDLVEIIRERLAYSFIPKYAFDNKELHAIVLSETLAEKIQKEAYYPLDESAPVIVLDPVDKKKIKNEVMEKSKEIIEAYGSSFVVFLCLAHIRFAFEYSIISELFPDVPCISERELFAIRNKYTVKVEATLNYDGE